MLKDLCILCIVAARVAERPSHSILGQAVEVQLVDTESATGECLLAPGTHMDTIVVKGLGEYNDELVLDLYFTNKVASGGGEVKKVEMKGTEAYVTFVDPEGSVCEIMCVFIHSTCVSVSLLCTMSSQLPTSIASIANVCLTQWAEK